MMLERQTLMDTHSLLSIEQRVDDLFATTARREDQFAASSYCMSSEFSSSRTIVGRRGKQL